MPTTATGKYEVLGKLADTATTELFVARTDQGGAQRFVVLKRLRRDAARDLARAKAFLDRAKLVSHIEHPNVAQAHECGKLGGSYFCALELVDGETISALIEHARTSKIPLPVRVVLTLAAGAAAGLHHAHERRAGDGKLLGIVHGNLSPSSMMVTRDGIVKLVGFARIPETRDVAYSSPELRDGRPIDRRSDLYSLGLVLWELLTLEPLPRDDDAPAPAPSSKRYELPKELDAMFAKLLAKEPADRYATAGELLAAIEGLAAKLELSLSTTDLARVMRLWYGDPGAGANDEVKSVIVESDPVPADLVAAASPIDTTLEQVRINAAAIRRLVATAATTPSPRRQRITAVPLGEPTGGELRESFEQIRDRILANARPKKDSTKPETNADAGDPARKKPETLNPNYNPYSYITNVKGKAAEPLRSVTGTPPLGTPSDGNVTVAKVELAKKEIASVPLRIEEKIRAIQPDDRVVVEVRDVATAPTLLAVPVPVKLEEKVEAKSEPEPEKTEAKPEPEPEKTEATPEPEPEKVEAKPEPEPEPEPETSEPEKTKPEPRAASHADDDEPHDAPAPRAPWLVPVLAAGVAVAAIAIVLVMHGGNKRTAAAPPPPAPRPAIADARTQVAQLPIDSAPALPAPVPIDAAIAAVAPVPPVAIDAAPVITAPPDAERVAVAPPDAAAVHHEHHHDAEPTGDEPPPKPPKPAKDERTIEQLFEAGEFDKASTACTSNTQFNTPRLIDCALAACHVHDAALAKRWSRAVGSGDRAQVTAQCHDLGVDLDAP